MDSACQPSLFVLFFLIIPVFYRRFGSLRITKRLIMAWIFSGKHFGGYTYEHWFDEDAPGAGDGSDAKTRTAAEPAADAGTSATGSAGSEDSPDDTQNL
jgi:hypothetical protein